MDILKDVHVIAALVSISGFTVRGVWSIIGSDKLQKRWVKVVPHINDTVFLLSGIALAIQIQQYPFVNTWLTVKVLGLLVYILLGMVALRFASTSRVKALAFLSAITIFIYIALVALTKNPLLSV